ncbi:MAG: D-Ala-D-Ala dipeptidase [Bacteroidota bacterium]
MPLLFLVFFLRILSEPSCVYEKTMAQQGLVEVQQAIPGILVELKYATTDNFMHKNVYGCLQKAYLQKEVVARLKKAQDYLSASHPGYHLLIYDATRPLSKQWDLWNALPQYSPKVRSNYVANPAEHSIHNYGSAVDLTVADEQGRPLDMGTHFDFFGEMAYPSREKALLASGKLKKEAYSNRLILRKAMIHGGFMPIEYEWWHFNAFSRAEAKRRFAVLK